MAISIQRLDLVPVDEESRPAAERPENRSRGVSHHPINRRGTNMIEPAKRIPTWLTIDIAVIVVSLAIIAVAIGIGIVP